MNSNLNTLSSISNTLGQAANKVCTKENAILVGKVVAGLAVSYYAPAILAAGARAGYMAWNAPAVPSITQAPVRCIIGTICHYAVHATNAEHLSVQCYNNSAAIVGGAKAVGSLALAGSTVASNLFTPGYDSVALAKLEHESPLVCEQCDVEGLEDWTVMSAPAA